MPDPFWKSSLYLNGPPALWMAGALDGQVLPHLFHLDLNLLAVFLSITQDAQDGDGLLLMSMLE